MKTLIVSLLIGFFALVAGFRKETCYKGDFQGYHVQVDTVTRWGRTTSLVVVRPLTDSLPTIRGAYDNGECVFLTLSNPHRFAAQPAKSKDPLIKRAWRLLEASEVAVRVDANVIRPYVAPLWIRVAKLVPHRFL